jgi:hypothetical protein
MKTEFDILRIADVIEFRTWASGRPTSISTLKEDLESVAEPSSDDESDYEFKEELFGAAQNVFDEFSMRRDLLPTAYPFLLDGDTIKPNVEAGG